MNAARRARQKNHRAQSGGHTVSDHQRIPDPDRPGKMINVRCLICKPEPKKWDRSLAGKAI